jgi:predicted metal-dependent hydrolase
LNKYKAILEEERKDFGINDDFKIIMKKMKAASISFKTRIIRINKELDCDQEFINYLIYHELAHFKLGTELHSKEFLKLLNSKLGEEKVKILEKRYSERC